jgi:Putative transposase
MRSNSSTRSTPGYPKAPRPPQVGSPDAYCLGADGERLDDVRAEAKATVDKYGETVANRRDDFRQSVDRGASVILSSATVVGRFGSSANLNVHLHCLVLDGAYRTKANGEPEFIEIPAPSDDDVWEVLQSIITRVMKQLVRRGVLVEDHGETYLANDEDDSEEARTLRPFHRGSCVYRIAFGPRACQKVLTLQGALPRETTGKQRLCADLQGFSVHAAVRCGAGQRKTLERLCRYITRPALANERVQCNAPG